LLVLVSFSLEQRLNPFIKAHESIWFTFWRLTERIIAPLISLLTLYFTNLSVALLHFFAFLLILFKQRSFLLHDRLWRNRASL